MQWTLDSCNPGTNDNCVVEVDSNFDFVRFVSKCSAHQTITDDVTGFNAIRQENTRGPGNAGWELLDKGPTSLYDIATDGSGSKTLKRGIIVDWQWTGTPPNRVLGLTVSGVTLTQTQRNNIQTFLNNRFGAGKVVFS